MPPKGKPSKAEQQQKQKKVEDKTFGLKNKNKSKAVQNYIKQATESANAMSKDEKQRRKEKEEREKAQREKAERDAIFKPVVSQKKPPPGADPKSVICAFFKEGKCTKGAKCKFSHDLSQERKAAKINIYADRREEKEKEDIYKDQETLEKAITDRNAKSGQRCASDKICKHFLDAVERRQYGWVWVCPNGGDKCQYRHALPPGFKLKSELEAERLLAADVEEERLEDQIEEQRAALKVRTPLTFEMFVTWRERKKREMQEEADKKLAAAKDARAKGKQIANNLTGRQLFEFDPTLFGEESGGGGESDTFLAEYKAKRAKDEDEGDEADYALPYTAQPLYDPNAQHDPLPEEEVACLPCSDADEEIEWFCDGCDGDILGDYRYDCPVCDDEFCYCPDCFVDPTKAHAHDMVKMPRTQPHLSVGGKPALPTKAQPENGDVAEDGDVADAAGAETSRGGVDAPPDLSAVDESLFADDDEVEEDA
mmetsp:Transcript_11321/g.30604  ORF Transcript_11321/g.30604 Transcript_11321/m.30604 type:complete len:482 (-) Transcript_11321:166-1611(-)